jgi:kynurenine formamidase
LSPLPAELRELSDSLSNWGRWGDEDERGTLNLLTQEVRERGFAAMRTGKAFSLALPLGPAGPQIGTAQGRANPLRWMSSVNDPLPGDDSGLGINDDVALLGLQSATHWDALAHVSSDGVLYNGFDAATVTTAGAARCGIDKVGVVAGGAVLLDVARAKGFARLEPGYAITADDLDTAEAQGRVNVAAGDIVLIRTGQIQLFKTGRRAEYPVPCPGVSVGALSWLRARDVAAVATDTFVFEVYPYERDDWRLPVHQIALVAMGLTVGENWDLEELARDCAADRRYDMFLTATPEPFVNGLGGPVNPVAIK